jgi:hypothetical protein
MAADLNDQLESASEVVHKLPEIGEALFAVAATRTGIVLGAIALAWLVFRILSRNWVPLFEVIERKRKQRLTALDNFVKEPSQADEATLAVMRDVREAAYFEAAIGIYAERAARASLRKLHESSPAVITWRRISRAYQYLSTDSEIALVAISKLDTLSYWYSVVVATLFLSGGFLMMVSSAVAGLLGWKFGMAIIASGIVSLGFGLIVLTQNIPQRTARIIAAEIKRVKQRDAITAEAAEG